MNNTKLDSLPKSYDFRSSTKESIEKYFSKDLIAIDANIPITKQILGTAMDFELALKPVYRKPVDQYGMQEYTSRRFLVNTANDEVFDIVGKNWQPHQPREVLSTFQDWCNEQPELKLTHVGQLDGGKIIYALADYPNVIQFREDITIAKVLLSNFNKLGFSTRVDLLTYRIVCSNGMTVKNTENNIRVNHTNLGEISDRLSSGLNTLHRNFHDYQTTMQELTKVTMSKSEAIALLIKQFGDPSLELDDQPKAVGVILQLFEGKGKGSEYLSAYNTAYGLLQASTEYLNHHSRQTKTHLSSMLYGSKNNTAQNMMQSLSATYL